MLPNFEWDEEKARLNRNKHQVSFDEATTVFADQSSTTIADPDHSKTEQRYIIIGISNRGRMLVIVYTERRGKIRIISCRKATATERRQYEESGE